MHPKDGFHAGQAAHRMAEGGSLGEQPEVLCGERAHDVGLRVRPVEARAGRSGAPVSGVPDGGLPHPARGQRPGDAIFLIIFFNHCRKYIFNKLTKFFKINLSRMICI